MALDEEEAAEQEGEEGRRRNAEYLDFRRRFDQMKTQHEAQSANCDKLKDQGNDFFKLGLYTQASMIYSEALELQPDNAVLYCNRSMAYLKQDMPHEALADAERSLELDASVNNVKAYWRKSQSLLDLDRFEESESVADAGLALQPANQHLNRVRRKAREQAILKVLCGEWKTSPGEGVEKRYAFEPDGTMKIFLFGHHVLATFDLSVEGNPRSMVVRMKPEGFGAGAGPPPGPRPYIFELRDGGQELWLCTPVGSDQLPTKFEGPGFDRLRRAAAGDLATGEATDEPLDARCELYLREMNAAMPELPPQLPEAPSAQQIDQETVVLESISRLKRRFGPEVHQRAVELARAPATAPSPALAELAAQLRARFIARRIFPQEAPPAVGPSAAVPPGAAAAPVAAPAAPGALGRLARAVRFCCGGSG